MKMHPLVNEMRGSVYRCWLMLTSVDLCWQVLTGVDEYRVCTIPESWFAISYFDKTDLCCYSDRLSYLFEFILSMSWNTIFCCSSSNLSQRSSSSFCLAVRVTGLPSVTKSWDKVMPNASQIFSSDGTVGTISFLYHDEIVDCGRPERSASWYSLHPRSSRYSVIADRTSFISIPLLLAFFVDYTSLDRCIIIIYVV